MSQESESLVLDVQGVGYELNCSSQCLRGVAGQEVVSLFVHTHVREDALQLFGFLDASEKELFLSLTRVNGIGPKLALKILSGSTTLQLVEMIESEDVQALTRIPKVGRKTAEQIILSLKGKLVLTDGRRPSQSKDIVSALVNLGFRLTDAEKVVVQLPANTGLEEGVKLSLQALTQL